MAASNQNAKSPSQNDLFALALGEKGLVVIVVGGKASEPFVELVKDWNNAPTPGKTRCLDFLLRTTGLSGAGIDDIRYQLLHRTASAVLEARRFGVGNAVMMVHSFSDSGASIGNYQDFAGLYGLARPGVNEVVFAKDLGDVRLYLGWVKHEQSS